MSVSDFESKAVERRVTSPSIKGLLEQHITSEKILSIVTEDELDKIPSDIISLGDKARLRLWKKELSRTDNQQLAPGEGAVAMVAGPPAPQPAENQDLAEVFNEELTEVDIMDCTKQLELGKKVKENIEQYVQKHGMEGLIETLTQDLNQFENSPIQIAVIGRAGTGKSTIINTLRGLRASHAEAADVGVKRTTNEPKAYKFPKHKNVRLWDLPGVNTPKDKREEYLKQVGFDKYDAYMIISADRFSEDDQWLASNVDKENKFYFIRTKVDQDITNNNDDKGISEKITLQTIREEAESELQNIGRPSKGILFLLSGRYENQTRWGFPALVESLVNNTPTKNRNAILMSAIACSSKIIRFKWQELDKHLADVVLEAVLSDKQKYKQVLTEEVNRYRERLGVKDLHSIDNTEEKRMLDTCIKNLDALLEIPLNSTNWEDWCIRGLKWFGRRIDSLHNKLNEMQVDSKRTLLALRTQGILRQILLNCHSAAQVILREKQLNH